MEPSVAIITKMITTSNIEYKKKRMKTTVLRTVPERYKDKEGGNEFKYEKTGKF